MHLKYATNGETLHEMRNAEVVLGGGKPGSGGGCLLLTEVGRLGEKGLSESVVGDVGLRSAS